MAFFLYQIWDVRKGDILFESAVLSGWCIIFNTNIYRTEIEILHTLQPVNVENM